MNANRHRIRARRADDAAFAKALADGRLEPADLEAHRVNAGVSPEDAAIERARAEGMRMVQRARSISVDGGGA